MSRITTSDADTTLVSQVRELLNIEELSYVEIQFTSERLLLRNCEDIPSSFLRMIESRCDVVFRHVGIDDNNSFVLSFDR